ncbi:hypothetical protein FPK15_contig00088-0003 [Flavobacterium psychrophilum]|nr:hypothetical protein FPK15_contig00088-0003 [Flavobacterium psychrophilum]
MPYFVKKAIDINFIFRKKMIKKFEKKIFLFKKNSKIIKKHHIGVPIAKLYKLVISEQKTLFYKILKDKNQIDLLSF